MKRMFLEKFFPTSRTASILKEIRGIRQHIGGTLYEYWERFNKFMASNTQQFGVKGSIASRVVNKRLDNKITELTSLVRQLVIGQHHTSLPAKVCGIFTSIEHPTDGCPTLQEIEPNSAEVDGLISGQKYGGQ
ncbi:hypothetical protein CR513_48317, partial [Mucuna pruriens]